MAAVHLKLLGAVLAAMSVNAVADAGASSSPAQRTTSLGVLVGNDDSAASGGFQIYTYADDERSPEVFDAWVESFADVESYFRESGWNVDWLDKPLSGPQAS